MTDDQNNLCVYQILSKRLFRMCAIAMLMVGVFLYGGNKACAEDHYYEAKVRPVLEKYCFGCHGEKKQKGDLRLDTLQADFVKAATAGKWVEVMDNMNLGEMPPEERDQPSVEELRVVTSWVAKSLRAAEREALSQGGRVLLRRLNRLEYRNTIRDLFKIEFLPGQDPMRSLPPDGVAEGFDKVSAALMMDPSLLENYFQAATNIADLVLVDGPPEYPTQTMRMEMEEIEQNRAISYLLRQPGMESKGDHIAIYEGSTRSFGRMKYPGTRLYIPVEGMYRLRVRAWGRPGEDGKPILMRIRHTHPEDTGTFLREVEVTDEPKIYEYVVPRDPKSGEYHVSIVNGTGFVQHNHPGHDFIKANGEAGKKKEHEKVIRLEGRYIVEGFDRSRPNPDSVDLSKLPALFVDYIEVTGPLYDQWPPKSHEIVKFKGDETKENPEAYAEAIFERLLPRMFRRPLREGEAKPYVKLVKDELSRGVTFNDALRVGIVGALCSPSFLYLHEPADGDQRVLNDYELASRLSYFLWSSMPDAELLGLASEKKLSDPKVLSEQVDRMIADEKSDAFVKSFGGQWLGVGEFRNFAPDPYLYKAYNEALGEAMVNEPLAFFREVLKSDQPATAFIDSDWTMVNEKLAGFYGIEGVEGEAFRYVKLPDDSKRGGLLAMAGVAMRGSDGTRTKPVHRAAYVLEVLFNDPPDPPPPNAGEIEPNIKGEHLTVRERLLQHQQIESCAACHRRLDPYGLALENFNVIGQWRERQDGEKFRGRNRPEIDVSSKLPNGESFATFEGFKALLMKQKARFARGLSEKMIVYALGRAVLAGDRKLVDGMADAMAKQDYRLRAMIKTLVLSESFRMK